MDYLLYKFLSPIFIGFIILSISISTKYFSEKISKLILTYQIFVLFYSITNYMEFISTKLPQIIVFAKLQHFFIIGLSISWFLFSLAYTGYDWIFKKKSYLILMIFGLFNWLVILTNDYHNLFWVKTILLEKNGVMTLNASYGFYFWIVTSFDYILLIAGVVFIIIAYVRGRSLFQVQARLIIAGFLFPLVVNLIYIFRIIPGFDKDYSSMAFSVTSLFIFISIYRFKLLHFSPLSRNIIINDLEEIILTLDTKFHIIDYNLNAELVFNLTEKSLGDDYRNTEVKSVLNGFDILKSGGSLIRSFNNVVFNIRVKNLLTNNNKIKAYLISMSDITDKMSLISELETTNCMMLEMQSKLVENEKMAALGHLSAGIAHEINNPLSFIKSNYNVLNRYLTGIKDLCKSDENDKIDKLHKFIDNIQDIIDDSNDGILRINEVVHNLLSFSRESNNEKKIEYDLNKGIESTLVIARSNIKYIAKVELELSDLPLFYTYGNDINQVLLNLITNAAQSIPEESAPGLIKIKTFYENSNIICEISDSGTLIKPEDREVIFRPFYTTKKSDLGTGLGLSISRSIIQKDYNGRIYVKDSEEKTFRIEIPYH